jgi:hypothetical protein
MKNIAKGIVVSHGGPSLREGGPIVLGDSGGCVILDLACSFSVFAVLFSPICESLAAPAAEVLLAVFCIHTAILSLTPRTENSSPLILLKQTPECRCTHILAFLGRNRQIASKILFYTFYACVSFLVFHNVGIKIKSERKQANQP